MPIKDDGDGGGKEPGTEPTVSMPPKVELKSSGEQCSAADQCGTGLCVDGVCCETACDDQCSACNEPTLEGQCVSVAGEPRPDRAACDPGAVCFEGACSGDDPTLASLEITGGELDKPFDPAQSAYVVTYSPLSLQVTIVAGVTGDDSTLKIDGKAATTGEPVTFPLVAQSLQVPIEVTAATGKTETYTLVFTAAPDADYTYVKASNTREGALFGDALQLHEGQLIVGSPFESSGSPDDPNDASSPDAGAVYVYNQKGGWMQPQYLKAERPVEGGKFGASLAASGDLLAVGSPQGCGCEPVAPMALPGATCELAGGEVLIFRRDADGVWNPVTCVSTPGGSNDFEEFGASVALDGDTLVVGSSNASGGTGVSSTVTNLPGNNPGAAYVFRTLDGGRNWGLEAFMKALVPYADRAFGQALAVEGNRLVVGDPGDPSSSTMIDGSQLNAAAPSRGAVFVFERSGETWTQAAFLKASNQRAQGVGASVALAGDRVAVGAPDESNAGAGINPDGDVGPLAASGAVYVFAKYATAWAQESYIKAKLPADNAYFGTSVALIPGQLLVGAVGDPGTSAGVNPPDSGNANRAGAAYLFTLAGTIWRQHAYIKASNPETNDEFGEAVATDGSLYVVGATAEDGSSAGINGPVNDNLFQNAGAVYIIK
jgi:hypothetical protein